MEKIFYQRGLNILFSRCWCLLCCGIPAVFSFHAAIDFSAVAGVLILLTSLLLLVLPLLLVSPSVVGAPSVSLPFLAFIPVANLPSVFNENSGKM
jgi:hypothetical protein